MNAEPQHDDAVQQYCAGCEADIPMNGDEKMCESCAEFLCLECGRTGAGKTLCRDCNELEGLTL